MYHIIGIDTVLLPYSVVRNIFKHQNCFVQHRYSLPNYSSATPDVNRNQTTRRKVFLMYRL